MNNYCVITTDENGSSRRIDCGSNEDRVWSVVWGFMDAGVDRCANIYNLGKLWSSVSNIQGQDDAQDS